MSSEMSNKNKNRKVYILRSSDLYNVLIIAGYNLT